MDCKECVFALWDKKTETQTGCSANRLDKLVKLNNAQLTTKENTSYYELKQFCNLYRTSQWVEKQKNPDDTLSLAREEIKSKFGIVIYDTKNEEDKLSTTLESIKEIDYDPQRIRIIISSYKEKGVQNLVSKVIDMQNNKFSCITSFHCYDDNVALRDYECFSKLYRHSYFVKVKSGSEISKNFFTEIDKSLNDNLERKAIFEDTNNGVFALPFGVVNKEYLNYNDYALMVDNIKTVAQQGDQYCKV